ARADRWSGTILRKAAVAPAVASAKRAIGALWPCRRRRRRIRSSAARCAGVCPWRTAALPATERHQSLKLDVVEEHRRFAQGVGDGVADELGVVRWWCRGRRR